MTSWWLGRSAAAKLHEVLGSLDPGCAVIVCVADGVARDCDELRSRVPAICHWYRSAKTGRIRCCWWRVRRCGESKLLQALRQTLIRAAARKSAPGHAGSLHDGHEAQHEQCADLHAGQCGIAAARAGPTFFAVAGADPNHSQHGHAHQRNHAAILIAGQRDARG